jgi:PAS domain S-box-containing protein
MSTKQDSSGLGIEDLYRHVVECSPNAIVIHCDGLIAFANPAAVGLYGAERVDQIVGIPILNIIHPDYHKAVLARVKMMTETGVITPMIRLKCIRITGEERDVEVLSVPIKYGDKMSVLVTIQDVTEDEKHQAELRIFSRVVEQSPNSIVITDRDGLITYVNPRFEELTGYEMKEVVGKNPRVIQSGMTPPNVYIEMWETITTGGEWRGELCNKRKSGELYWEYCVISGLRDLRTGQVTHFIAVKNDITKKREYEKELKKHRDHLQCLVDERTLELLRAKEQAESANVAKSAFLANMSHEIRTPMNGIIGMAHILRRKGVTDQQARCLEVIETSGQHLLGVINNILDISKIEAGMLSLEEIPLDINGLLTNAVAIQSEQAKAKGVRLLIEDAPSWPVNVVGDPTRLQQALINYLTNAIKFTEKGVVVVRAIKVSEAHESIHVRFEVIDSGAGISPSAMSKLFNVFEQLDNSMTRKYGGTGLGLSITKRLANLMGGEVGVKSTEGQGSTFWFTAILKKIERRENPTRLLGNLSAEDAVRVNHGGRTVLVVDDEPINREIAKLQLEFADIVVHLAENGSEALARAEQSSYAAIFMDMQMPVMNGLEAAKAIRMLPHHKNTPIIAVTANASPEDKKLCTDFGMDDFVTKPFTPEDLFEKLLKWLSK